MLLEMTVEEDVLDVLPPLFPPLVVIVTVAVTVTVAAGAQPAVVEDTGLGVFLPPLLMIVVM